MFGDLEDIIKAGFVTMIGNLELMVKSLNQLNEELKKIEKELIDIKEGLHYDRKAG